MIPAHRWVKKFWKAALPPTSTPDPMILGISGYTQRGSIRGPGSHIESHDSMMMSSFECY